MSRFVLLVLVMGVVGGCTAVSPFQVIRIDGLVLQNQTAQPLENITLMIENTREFASCAFILAGSSFSTRFPNRRYQGNPVRVTWTHQGRKWESKKFIIKPPDDLNPNKPVQVRISFFEDGLIDYGMIQ